MFLVILVHEMSVLRRRGRDLPDHLLVIFNELYSLARSWACGSVCTLSWTEFAFELSPSNVQLKGTKAGIFSRFRMDQAGIFKAKILTNSYVCIYSHWPEYRRS